MGRVAGVQTYENLIRILFILRDAPKVVFSAEGKQIQGMTVKQVHQELESQGEKLAEKTVNKYLKQLEIQRPPQVTLVHTGEKNINYWALPENSPLNDSTVSDFEAAMICLSSELLEPLLPPTLQRHLTISRERAMGILSNARPMGILPDNSPLWALKLVNRVWIEKPPELDGGVQEVLFNAIRAKKRLRISYLSNQRRHAGQGPVTSEVSPVRLVQHGDARLYLIVAEINNPDEFNRHDTASDDYRRLAVHRIQSAEQIDQDVSFPESLRTKIDQEPGFGWKGKIQLKALVSTGVGMRLEECALNETQKLTITDRAEWHPLEVEIDDNWELRWWVLSNGSHIVIQEPIEFRNEIANNFRDGFSNYFS